MALSVLARGKVIEVMSAVVIGQKLKVGFLHHTKTTHAVAIEAKLQPQVFTIRYCDRIN